MEQVNVNLMVSGLNATLADDSRKETSVLPVMFRGMPTELAVKLLNGNGSAYPAAQLEGLTWRMVASNVWNPAATPLMESTDITVEGSTIRVAIEETDTKELAAVIGTMESVTLGAEIYGIPAGEEKPSVILQFGLKVRNRRAGTGEPTSVAEDGVTATQVKALLSAGMEVQCSTDGERWETPDGEHMRDYRWHRLRNTALPSAEWSEPIPLIVGATGPAGSIEIGSVAKGDEPSVTNSGTPQNAVLDIVLPKGDQGASASVAIGATATGEPGTQASVENAGDEHNAVLRFTIPRGADGTVAFDSLTDAQRLSLKGDKGDAATVAVGGVTTLQAGEEASVSNAGTSHDAILQFAIPRGDTGAKGDKGDRGEQGPPGPACSLQIGTVAATETGTPPTASITGEAPNQTLNLTMPKGFKGDKGDNATISVGNVSTGAAGTAAAVTNRGTAVNAVLDFTLPRGDKGDSTYLHVAWARDSLGTGFSLAPSDDRKYRAELLLPERREDLTAEDFAGCAWTRCGGRDGISYGAVAATDGSTVIPEVRRLVFANATLTAGADGEATVSFNGGGTGGEEMFNGVQMLGASLSTTRSGGGSPGGDSGVELDEDGGMDTAQQTDTSQSTWEA
jgi:hypothetical protein